MGKKKKKLDEKIKKGNTEMDISLDLSQGKKNLQVNQKIDIGLPKEDEFIENLEGEMLDNLASGNPEQSDNYIDEENEPNENNHRVGDLQEDIGIQGSSNSESPDTNLEGEIEEPEDDVIPVPTGLSGKKSSRKNNQFEDSSPDSNEQQNINTKPHSAGRSSVGTSNGIGSPNNNDETSESTLANLINSGNKIKALALLGDLTLDALEGEKALRLIKALRDRGLLNNDDEDEIDNIAKKRQKPDYSGMKSPDLIAHLPNAGEGQEEPILQELANRGHSFKDLPSQYKNKYGNGNDEDAESSTEPDEDSTPMQRPDKLPPRFGGHSSKTSKPKDTAKKKKDSQSDSLIGDSLEKETKKKGKEIAIGILEKLFLTAPMCFYTWGILLFGLIIIVTSTSLIICVKEPELGLCSDLLSSIGSGMRTAIENIVNGAIDWIEAAISNIDPTYKEKSDVVKILNEAARNTGLAQEF